MKLPLLAALAGSAAASAIAPRAGSPVCNTSGISTLRAGITGFYQTFCITKTAVHIAPGQSLTQDIPNGDSVVTLAVQNVGSQADWFYGYACTTAFGLTLVCPAAADNTRTFGGSFTDGTLIYKISATPVARVQKPEVHPVGADRNTNSIHSRQIGQETLTCSSASDVKQAHNTVHAMIEGFCQQNSVVGKQLQKGDSIQSTYLANNSTVTISVSNVCSSTLYLPASLCTKNLGAVADCTDTASDLGFTYGGHRESECVGYDIDMSPVTAKHDDTRDLVIAGDLERRQDIPQNCINKADPKCQIAQWTCTYGSGYTLPHDYLNKAIVGLCDTYHGLLMPAQTWFSRTYRTEGHEVWMAIHTSSNKAFLLDVNLCIWYFDGIRDQCSTGKGSQGGYDWIPPSGLTFVIGVAGAYKQDSKYCGGYC